MKNKRFKFLSDGGAVAELSTEEDNVEKSESLIYQSNLAAKMSRGDLNKIGGLLKSSIDEDISSRKPWEEVLLAGFKQIGFKQDESNTFPSYRNSYGINSFAVTQSAITFISNATAELLPPEGPCVCLINGIETEELKERADRVQAWFNLYLTRLAPEFYKDYEQSLLWFFYYGNLFKKVYQDPILNRPVSPYIELQNIVVNQNASSIQTASRITHILKVTKKEALLRQKLGFYTKVPSTPSSYLSSDFGSEITEELDKIKGFEKTESEYDVQYDIYECHVDLDPKHLNIPLDDNYRIIEGIPLPFIISIEKETSDVLSIRKNWKDGDRSFKKINHFTHCSFFPGLGFLGQGMIHLAGGNARVSCELQNQLLKAGELSNSPGGLRAKGMSLGTNNIIVGPGEFPEIDTGGSPIQEALQFLPFKEPSSILYEMKKELDQDILGIAGASNQPYADFNPNAPVGTTLALLEQTHRVQSSVMRRLHSSMAEEFQMMFELFGQYLSDEPYPFNVVGNRYEIMRSDFGPTLSIRPVSNPNISNSMQRLVRAEAVLRFAQQSPDIHDLRNIYDLIYKELKIPNEEIDKILPPPQQEQPPPPVVPLDPLTENQNITQNKPVKAALWQDHQSHITVHNMLGDGNPIVSAHIQEHKAYDQQNQLQKKLGFDLPPNLTELDPQAQNFISASLARASDQIQQEQMQQNPPPPPPIDPTIAMLKDVEMKGRANEQKFAIEQKKLEFDQIKLEREKELEFIKAQIHKEELEVKKMELQLAVDKTQKELEIKGAGVQQKSEEIITSSQFEKAKLLQKDEIEKLKLEQNAMIEEIKLNQKNEIHDLKEQIRELSERLTSNSYAQSIGGNLVNQ